MKKPAIALLKLAPIAVVAAVAACAPAPGVVPGPIAAKSVKAATAAKSKQGLIVVSNGGRLVAKNQKVTLTSEKRSLQQAVAAVPVQEFPYDITYTAQVPPVLVGGDPVQANDIEVCGCDRAIIAYNTAGDVFAGAIQIVDTRDRAHPVITKEIKFGAMDINAVASVGNTLYFGGQADPDVYGFKAFVAKVDLTNLTAAAITAGMKPVRSHAVTAIAKSADEVFVGVGARDGGVEVFDLNLAPKRFVAKTDVRSIAYAAGTGVFGLAGTTDGAAAGATFFPINAAGRQPIGLGDFRSDYAKATVELGAGSLAYMGLSQAGMQVRKVDGGALSFSLPNPSNDPLDATNGVSTDNDLAFVANGEYGFRVVRIKSLTGVGAAFGEVAGYHRLSGPQYDGKRYSANLVKYKGGHLFVASGLGGVNLYGLTAQ